MKMGSYSPLLWSPTMAKWAVISPKTLSFKGIADKLKQRISDILGYKYWVETEPIYIDAPERHQGMIRPVSLVPVLEKIGLIFARGSTV